MEYTVGLIGAGYVSSYHIRALQSLEHVRILGITDLDQDRARDVAGKFGIPFFRSAEDLYRECPGVVHVLTPPSSHCQLTLEALDHGCHVFIEKPMALSEEECDLMIKKAGMVKRSISIDHSAKFDPVIQRALSLIEKGKIGEVLTIDYLRSSEYPPYRGGSLPAQFRDGGYPFRDLGVHALYLAETILGKIGDVQTVHTSTGKHSHLSFDQWRSLIHCERGVAQVQLSWSVKPIEHTLFIQGTKGGIFLDLYLETCVLHRSLAIPKPAAAILNAVGTAAHSVSQVLANTFKVATGRMLRSPDIHQAVREFHLALAAGTPPPVSAEEGKRMVSWVEKSARVADEAKRQASVPAALKPAEVLVTGGTGFLGKALVRTLLAKSKTIRVLARKNVPAEFADNPLVDIVRGDLGNPEIVEGAIAGVKVVYHVGSATGGSWADYECGTIEGTKNVVESCLRNSVTRLVHVSSLSVLRYAGLRQPATLDETAELEPFPEKRGHYANAKLQAENIVVRAVQEHGLNAVIVRPGNIFGPGAEKVPPYGVFALGNRWMVMGNGKCLLPLVYIDDVVDALIRAGQTENAGKIVNLVDPDQITHRDYLKYMRLRLPEVHAHRVPMTFLHAAAVPLGLLGTILRRAVPLTTYRLRSIQPQVKFDCRAAERFLGWVPQVGVSEGARITFGSQVRRTVKPLVVSTDAPARP